MYVTLPEFETAVRTLQGLLKQSQAHLLVTSGTTRPPAYFDVRADDATSIALLSEDRRAAVVDVTDALSAVLYGADEDRFVDVRTDEDIDEEPEEAEVARQKYRLVTQEFPVDDLRRRYALKRSAKARTMASFDWEVVTRVAEEDAPGDVADEPASYALWKLTGEGSRYDERRRDLVLALDINDVEALLASLDRLKAVMGRRPAETVH